ncbi:hypothetical protein [Kitasatospora sp. NPDC093679]|uniref:hypothetical protein n=1 Tax=Kitasatospora sp. NPDC093679 TaxID=3154983 RepID=UPI00343B1318
MTDFLTRLSTSPDGRLVCTGLDYIEFDARLARDGSCPTTTKAAYMALATFADIEHHMTLTAESVAGWSQELRHQMLPYRKTVAACMGRSPKTFDRAVVDLVDRRFLVVEGQTSPEHPAVADASLYRLTDRERWARQLLERAADPAPTPLLGPNGRPLPRVRRTPGIDYVKLDARIARTERRSPNYKSVYAAVASFVNINNRAITDRPPTVAELCACTGLGRTAVNAALAQMRGDGLLATRENYFPAADGGGQAANSYFLLDARLWRRRAAARDDAELVTFTEGCGHQPKGGAVTTRRGVGSPAEGGSGHHAKAIKRSSENGGDEPLPDARRASAGGFARKPRSTPAASKPNRTSGSAATAKKPRIKTTRTTPSRPVPGEEEVFAMVDALGASTHPAVRVPPLRRAVRDLLRAGRTPEHALARINAGWWRAGVPERIAAGEIRRPVGYLATILSAQECERPDCERGIILGTGDDCHTCGLQAAERQAEHARQHLEQATAAPDQQPPAPKRPTGTTPRRTAAKTAVTWRCEAPGPNGLGGDPCGRPGTGTPPALRMCPDCLDQLRQALTA